MEQQIHLGQLFSSKQHLAKCSEENINVFKISTTVSAWDQFLNSVMGIGMHLINVFLEVSSIIFQGGSMVQLILFTIFYTNVSRYWHINFFHWIPIETLLEKNSIICESQIT